MYQTFKKFSESLDVMQKCPVYILCENCKSNGIQESEEYDMETKLSRLTYRRNGPDKVSLVKTCYECKSESEVDEEYLKNVV